MITQQEASARFGMSLEEAHKVRDRAAKACPDMAAARAARAAWQALADELRGSKGQPFTCPQHPESVRFRMLQAIADGGKPSPRDRAGACLCMAGRLILARAGLPGAVTIDQFDPQERITA